MKRILNRRTGSFFDNPDDARAFVRRVKREIPGVVSVEHRAVSGYPRAETAERANLNAIKEHLCSFISVFEGTEYVTFEGYKALFIGFQELPPNFETHFPNYVVVGE